MDPRPSLCARPWPYESLCCWAVDDEGPEMDDDEGASVMPRPVESLWDGNAFVDVDDARARVDANDMLLLRSWVRQRWVSSDRAKDGRREPYADAFAQGPKVMYDSRLTRLLIISPSDDRTTRRTSPSGVLAADRRGLNHFLTLRSGACTLIEAL